MFDAVQVQSPPDLPPGFSLPGSLVMRPAAVSAAQGGTISAAVSGDVDMDEDEPPLPSSPPPIPVVPPPPMARPSPPPPPSPFLLLCLSLPLWKHCQAPVVASIMPPIPDALRLSREQVSIYQTGHAVFLRYHFVFHKCMAQLLICMRTTRMPMHTQSEPPISFRNVAIEDGPVSESSKARFRICSIMNLASKSPMTCLL